MIIFPAVDIQGGKAVRLKRGARDDVTIFGEDPLAMARHWREQGARWLHVIDLDGAFDGARANHAIIGRICAGLDIPVQVGGGIRDLDDVSRYLDAGVRRVIIGTIALEKPDLFARMCARHPGQVGVSLDADNGRLKTRGWVRDTGQAVADVLPDLADAGAAFIIYTDIARDGMQSGINLEAMRQLLRQSPIPVIAAGGVANLDDARRLFALRHEGKLEGLISGRALYDKTLDLKEVQEWLDSQA